VGTVKNMGWGLQLTQLKTIAITARALLASLTTECSRAFTVGTIAPCTNAMTKLTRLFGGRHSRLLDNTGSGTVGAVAQSPLAIAFFTINGGGIDSTTVEAFKLSCAATIRAVLRKLLKPCGLFFVHLFYLNSQARLTTNANTISSWVCNNSVPKIFRDFCCFLGLGPLYLQQLSTTIQLAGINLRCRLDLFSHPHQPFLLQITLLAIAHMPFMVGQILVVAIPLGYTKFVKTDIGIPADEVYGITKIYPLGTLITGIFQIVIPGAINRLTVAVCRGWPG